MKWTGLAVHQPMSWAFRIIQAYEACTHHHSMKVCWWQWENQVAWISSPIAKCESLQSNTCWNHKAFRGLLTRLIKRMNISNSIYREPGWGADGFKIKQRGGESRKPSSEQGSFQKQQSLWAQLIVSSSRYLFVVLVFSVAVIHLTRRYTEGQAQTECSQAGYYASKLPLYKCTRKAPPASNLNTTTQCLKTLWSNTWSCEETLNTFTMEPLKRQNKLEWLGYLSESVFHQRTERKRGRRKKKAPQTQLV